MRCDASELALNKYGSWSGRTVSDAERAARMQVARSRRRVDAGAGGVEQERARALRECGVGRGA
jgi:hypothetical protein